MLVCMGRMLNTYTTLGGFLSDNFSCFVTAQEIRCLESSEIVILDFRVSSAACNTGIQHRKKEKLKLHPGSSPMFWFLGVPGNHNVGDDPG